jgi:ATP-dependent Clp protease adaptor protein ClpS
MAFAFSQELSQFMSTKIITKTQQRTKTPPQYKVLLLNDDYTPMDFVLYVLERFFNKSQTEAHKVMLEAHQKGLSVAGVYPFEIAETKVAQVLEVAKGEGYPLRVRLEPE